MLGFNCCLKRRATWGTLNSQHSTVRLNSHQYGHLSLRLPRAPVQVQLSGLIEIASRGPASACHSLPQHTPQRPPASVALNAAMASAEPRGSKHQAPGTRGVTYCLHQLLQCVASFTTIDTTQLSNAVPPTPHAQTTRLTHCGSSVTAALHGAHRKAPGIKSTVAIPWHAPCTHLAHSNAVH